MSVKVPSECENCHRTMGDTLFIECSVCDLPVTVPKKTACIYCGHCYVCGGNNFQE